MDIRVRVKNHQFNSKTSMDVYLIQIKQIK